AAFHEIDGARVARLDIRFQPVQSHSVEGVSHGGLQPAGHVPVTAIRKPCVVAERCVEKGAAHDVVEIDHTDYHRLVAPENAETFVGVTAHARENRLQRAGGGGG